MKKHLTFETKRLFLRPTSVEDAAFQLELLNTPKWLQYIGDRNVRNLEDAKVYIETKIRPQLDRLGFCNYTVIRKSDGAKLGSCGLYDREGLEGIDIGFAFLPAYEKMGYALESALKVKEVAIHNFGITTIKAITSKKNLSSQRLLEKLGLQFKEFVQLPNDKEELMLFQLDVKPSQQKETNEYILGTDQEELHRLGSQHQVWASEAQEGWRLANFNQGQTILDLGCGPGFCTKELAYLTGTSGKVIGIDRSENYIQYLEKITRLHGLNIEAIHSDFDEMTLEENTLDGMYCRWALAWHPDPKGVLEKVMSALKVGGKIVIHEYYDWSTFQTEPQKKGLTKAIAAALKSFKDSESEIDIGRFLPTILQDLGMEIVNLRLMSKLATPKDATWNWPSSFFQSYFPRLEKLERLTNAEVITALDDLKTLEQSEISTIFCPILIEVIAEKK